MLKSYLKPIFSALIIIFVLGGCATLESTTDVEWKAHQRRLLSLETYSASGKLAYISPEQRQSLNFQWSLSTSELNLRLTTFLGQTALNMISDVNMARVETYDDHIYQAETAEELITQLTGLNIPVNPLKKWLIGLPADVDNYTLNPTNTLASLTKMVDGKLWQVDYLSYQDVSYNQLFIPLPSKVLLTQGDTSIKLIISKWTLNND